MNIANRAIREFRIKMACFVNPQERYFSLQLCGGFSGERLSLCCEPLSECLARRYSQVESR